MSLAPGLVRLCLDVVNSEPGADDEPWVLACSLMDETNLEQARSTAWALTIFATRLLLRLREESAAPVDIDEIVAEWGLATTVAAEQLEVGP